MTDGGQPVEQCDVLLPPSHQWGYLKPSENARVPPLPPKCKMWKTASKVGTLVIKTAHNVISQNDKAAGTNTATAQMQQKMINDREPLNNTSQ